MTTPSLQREVQEKKQPTDNKVHPNRAQKAEQNLRKLEEERPWDKSLRALLALRACGPPRFDYFFRLCINTVTLARNDA